MTGTLSRSLVCSTLVVGVMTVFLSPSWAEASHRSFRYTGHCFGFPGEAEMMSALTNMDRALAAPCRLTRMQAVQAARHDLIHAQRAVVCPHARRELARSIGPLNVFAVTGEYYRLEEAASRVLQALEMERLVHAPPPRVHGFRGHHGPVSRRVAVPAPPVYAQPLPVAVPAHPVTIQLGGSRFSFGITF